jgi:hypothetical protein
MNIRRAVGAILMLLALGLSAARAQVAGDRIVCTGTVFTFTINPPNRMSWGSKDIIDEAQILDEASGDECFIDQDGFHASSQPWSCNSGDGCRVVGILAARISALVLTVPNGKRVSRWINQIMDVTSVERVR